METSINSIHPYMDDVSKETEWNSPSSDELIESKYTTCSTVHVVCKHETHDYRMLWYHSQNPYTTKAPEHNTVIDSKGRGWLVVRIRTPLAPLP